MTPEPGCRCGDCHRARVDAVDHRNKDTSWMALAACSDAPAEWFFPEKGEAATALQGRRLCTSCRARDACLSFAMTEPVETVGIWGGTTPTQRRRMREQRR